MKHYVSVLSNRKFNQLWLSQITSQLTIHIMNFLLILKMFEETGSTIATSLLWVAYATPSLLFGPLAAAVADTTDRRKILIASNSIQTVIVALSVFFVVDNIMTSYVFVFLYSVMNQFYIPSEFAALPSIVRKSNYAQANSLFLITQQIAIIVGFTIANSLESLFGFGVTLLICAGLLLVAAISVTFLPKMEIKADIPKDLRSAFKTYFSIIMEGYKFITGKKYVLIPFLSLIVMSVVVAVITVNMPVIAKDVMRVPAKSSGLVIALPVGIGAFVGAYFASKVLSRGVRKYSLIKTTLGLFSFGFLLITFVPLILPNLAALYMSIFGILILGFSFVGMIVPVLTYLQEAIPSDLRGRVFGNFWFVVTIISIIPVIFSGIISQYFGARLLFVLLTITSFAGFVFVIRNGENFVRSNFRK
ncbi:MFS transporter [Patescibacteria group bacterium]